VTEPLPPGLPDLVGPDLAVLFCGINPGWRSAEKGLHFGRPGNRFWKVLNGAGLTPDVLDPADQTILPSLGLGITNLVPRPTRSAAELTREELRAGASALEAKASRLAPRWVAVVGMDAYRKAFSRPRAAMGPQPEAVGPAGLWVLPNPSGLQARYGLAEMIAAYSELALAAGVRAGDPAVGWPDRRMTRGL
jgi:double-stranded uracil-DNA glycosylase